MLVLASAELNCTLPGDRDGHVLALGIDDALATLEGERRDLEGTADWIVGNGGVAYLAHPYWTGVTPGTLELPESVSGIEVYNGGCELEIGRGVSEVHWDELLEAGARCFGLATDDSHHPGFDSDLAWTWLRAEPTRDGVLEALRSGCFYATTGPRITSFVSTDGAVEVECDPCRSVTIVYGISGGASVHAGRLGYTYGGEILAANPDGLITAARLRRPETAAYARLRVTDDARPKGVDEPRMAVSEPRDAARAELARAPYDLLVVGGGIVGAGIASEAARRGLRVALVDRGDFGGATSSASSKLIHGGLRYLRLGDVKLVREAHTERRALLRIVAPHLVRRIPFLFPVYRGGPYRPATIQAGLWTYSTLAGEKLGGLVKPERARRSVPPLRLDGLRGCGVYQDAWTHDERLCLANVTAAEEAGATVLNYAEVVDLRIVSGRVAGAEVHDRIAGEVGLGRGACSRQRDGPVARDAASARGARRRAVRAAVKGVHVTLPLDEPWSAALTIPHDQVRVTFAVPVGGHAPARHDGHALRGRPGDVAATEDDVDRVLAEAAVAVDGDLLRRERVLSTYAGLRVLPAQRRFDRRRAPRDSLPRRQRRDAHGRRRQADDVPPDRARRARAASRPSSGSTDVDRRPVPLPGATDAGTSPRASSPAGTLEPAVAAHLAHFYGSRADRVVAPRRRAAGSARALHPDAPDIAAQVVFAAREEWATSADDVVHRRTTLAARGLTAPAVVARVTSCSGSLTVRLDGCSRRTLIG